MNDRFVQLSKKYKIHQKIAIKLRKINMNLKDLNGEK